VNKTENEPSDSMTKTKNESSENAEKNGYIYAIVNNVNGKRLAGQTWEYKRRIKEHRLILAKNKHENPHIQYAYNLYGKEHFSYEILKEIKCLQSELDKLEEKYRIEYFPNVYNIRTGGNGGCKFNEDAKQRMRESQQKLAKSTNSEKQRIAANKRWSMPNSKIWRKEMNDKIWNDAETRTKMVAASQQSAKARGQQQAKTYNGFISPTGQIYTPIVNLREFCRTHKLDRANLLKVYRKTKPQYKGWTKYE
jgi:group I intron endonuclease